MAEAEPEEDTKNGVITVTQDNDHESRTEESTRPDGGDSRLGRRTILKGIGIGALAGTSLVSPAAAGESEYVVNSLQAAGKTELVTTRFDSGGASCTSGVDDPPTVTCHGRYVNIEGSMLVPDPCHSAVLRSATYDANSDTLEVIVDGEAVNEGRLCVQCLGEVPYTFQAIFRGGAPETVKVYHGDELVVEASCDGGRGVKPL